MVTQQLQSPDKSKIIYPDDNGESMSENTEQCRTGRSFAGKYPEAPAAEWQSALSDRVDRRHPVSV